uniref:Uncharacterized protein n=1 Tax=Vitis vinifera TaxID=29760 RepID=A5BFJ0_VITVI|nr:hypothetical protein VITISV_041742 [Vitis vinifera]
MAPRREMSSSRAQGKRPAEPSQPAEAEAHQKARFDTDFFTSMEEYQRCADQASPETICRILDIIPVGLRVYESKAWPTLAGFEPIEAIQRMCCLADTQGMGKPSARSLTVRCRVLHHMILYILLPQGGHRDEVSYLEAFLIDSIMMGKWIDVSYDTYDEQSLGRMKFEKATDGSWIRRAERLVPQPRGQGETHPVVEEEDEIREMEETKFDIPPQQFEGGQLGATLPESMISEPIYTMGPSSQPSFTEPPHAQTSAHQAPYASDHASLIDLVAQISSLGTRMEELAIVSDMRFYSMEDRMDHYQTSFIDQFECLQ